MAPCVARKSHSACSLRADPIRVAVRRRSAKSYLERGNRVRRLLRSPRHSRLRPAQRGRRARKSLLATPLAVTLVSGHPKSSWKDAMLDLSTNGDVHAVGALDVTFRIGVAAHSRATFWFAVTLASRTIPGRPGHGRHQQMQYARDRQPVRVESEGVAMYRRG